MTSFSDPNLVSSYAENAARLVPGMHDLPKMAGVLLSECVSADARILILGAGGGLELKAFSELQPTWALEGVDPSAEMLQLARKTLGHLQSRVRLHHGYIDTAPAGPFDGATCLLTLHFLPRMQRVETLKAIHTRLRSGAPLVVVHHSFPNSGIEQDKWLSRSAEFAIASGMPGTLAKNNIPTLKARLPILTPEQDIEVLREAGFTGIELFYCAFTFKGWVAYKA